MNKCSNCNGCLRYIWYYGETYKYCPLCRIIYKVSPKGFTLVTDQTTIKEILKMIGNVIT